MKRRYYKKSLGASVVFACLSLVAIASGMLLVGFVPDLATPALILTGLGVVGAVFSLILMLDNLTRCATLLADGILLFVYDDQNSTRRKEKIKFENISSIYVTTYEGKRGSVGLAIFAVLLSFLLCSGQADATDGGVPRRTVCTIKLKDSPDLYADLSDYAEGAREEILSALEQYIPKE